MQRNRSIVPTRLVEHLVLFIRGKNVVLDSDLARLYAVETRALVQAVKRNLERFPPDFMIQLTKPEYESLRSQSVILKGGRGQHRKYLPYAFTEHGVAMLSSVLNSPRAIQVNITIMRAFSRLREILGSNKQIARKVLEHDKILRQVVAAVNQLLEQPVHDAIGFRLPRHDEEQ